MERKNNWSEADDQLLVETVVSHIRRGSTQLKAFEEVATKLRRTAAAAGFRWNNNLRKIHKAEMEQARKERLATIKSGPKHRTYEANTDETLIRQTVQYIEALQRKVQEQEQIISDLSKQLREKSDLTNPDDLSKLVDILRSAQETGFLGKAQ